MRINEIRKKEVDVTLTSDELVAISNMIYFYENHHSVDPNAGSPNTRFHEMAAQIITARDLCQYGHLDNHALCSIVRHNIQADPDGHVAKTYKEMIGGKAL